MSQKFMKNMNTKLGTDYKNNNFIFIELGVYYLTIIVVVINNNNNRHASLIIIFIHAFAEEIGIRFNISNFHFSCVSSIMVLILFSLWT